MPSLQATYSDNRGTEAIVIENDGQNLRTCIRGVRFEGTDFDSLEAQETTELFRLHMSAVCNCTIQVALPVRLRAPEGIRYAMIDAVIALGTPEPVGGGLDSEVIKLRIKQPEFEIGSSGRSGWFEDEMLELAGALPVGFHLEVCIMCGLSDYSPYGHGCFGWLACFRDAKEDYRKVSSKSGIFKIWDRMTEFVQETHYCDQYETRPKGRGYRG